MYIISTLIILAISISSIHATGTIKLCDKCTSIGDCIKNAICHEGLCEPLVDQEFCARREECEPCKISSQCRFHRCISGLCVRSDHSEDYCTGSLNMEKHSMRGSWKKPQVNSGWVLNPVAEDENENKHTEHTYTKSPSSFPKVTPKKGCNDVAVGSSGSVDGRKLGSLLSDTKDKIKKHEHSFNGKFKNVPLPPKKGSGNTWSQTNGNYRDKIKKHTESYNNKFKNIEPKKQHKYKSNARPSPRQQTKYKPNAIPSPRQQTKSKPNPRPSPRQQTKYKPNVIPSPRQQTKYKPNAIPSPIQQTKYKPNAIPSPIQQTKYKPKATPSPIQQTKYKSNPAPSPKQKRFPSSYVASPSPLKEQFSTPSSLRNKCDKCSTKILCKQGLKCMKGRCREFKHEKCRSLQACAPCTSREQCRAGKCINQRCGFRFGNNKCGDGKPCSKCSFGRECESGRCTYGLCTDLSGKWIKCYDTSRFQLFA